jgi:hypothetical protein
VTVTIPEAVLADTFKTMWELASYWHDELPMRLHSREVSDGGTPEWHHDFARWIGRADQFNDQRWAQNPEPRVKTTRAFRKLRTRSPREYEVVYRTAILRIPFDETVEWLNARAIRGGHPDRYDTDAALMLLICGVDKIATWFSWTSTTASGG